MSRTFFATLVAASFLGLLLADRRGTSADVKARPQLVGVENAVKPFSQWTGTLKDEKLRPAAPANGTIDNARDFAKLWKAWMGDKPVPAVDFKLELVLVGTAGPGYDLVLLPYLDKDGDLTVSAWSRLKGEAGFGYQIVTIDRTDIKSVNGKGIGVK
jgi:hypothetical protein